MPVKALFFQSLTLCAVLLGCSDSNGLPDAAIPNIEQTDTLWALVGTPVSTPSGYSVEPVNGRRRVRTDLSENFDFAYNVAPDSQPILIPRAALGIDTANSVNPGFQARTESFEAITIAPSDGYVTDNPVPIAAGQRYVVRSRVTCAIGVAKYAKMEILEFDEVARIVTFRVLTNDNCGFKGLEPGLPDR
jgi:hypothetical protein